MGFCAVRFVSFALLHCCFFFTTAFISLKSRNTRCYVYTLMSVCSCVCDIVYWPVHSPAFEFNWLLRKIILHAVPITLDRSRADVHSCRCYFNRRRRCFCCCSSCSSSSFSSSFSLRLIQCVCFFLHTRLPICFFVILNKFARNIYKETK